MPAKSPVQYTIRGVPREVDRELRRRAREQKVSLNRLLVEELRSVAGTPRKFRSLEGIAGAWKEDPEFDRALEEQRQIDTDLWK
jgi:hypothetical protein